MQKAHSIFGMMVGVGCIFIAVSAVGLGFTNKEILIILLMGWLSIPAFSWMFLHSREAPPHTSSRIRELESLCQEQGEWIQSHMEQAIRYAQLETDNLTAPSPHVETGGQEAGSLLGDSDRRRSTPLPSEGRVTISIETGTMGHVLFSDHMLIEEATSLVEWVRCRPEIESQLAQAEPLALRVDHVHQLGELSTKRCSTA